MRWMTRRRAICLGTDDHRQCSCEQRRGCIGQSLAAIRVHSWYKVKVCSGQLPSYDTAWQLSHCQ